VGAIFLLIAIDVILPTAGENSLLKNNFLRQPKPAADVISPYVEITNSRR